MLLLCLTPEFCVCFQRCKHKQRQHDRTINSRLQICASTFLREVFKLLQRDKRVNFVDTTNFMNMQILSSYWLKAGICISSLGLQEAIRCQVAMATPSLNLCTSHDCLVRLTQLHLSGLQSALPSLHRSLKGSGLSPWAAALPSPSRPRVSQPSP